MSTRYLSALPEELLNKISLYTAAAAAHYDENNNTQCSSSPRPISSGHEGLVPLSSTDTVFRRICTPILFSRVVVQRFSQGRPLFGEHIDMLVKVLKAKPAIAQLVTSIHVYDHTTKSTAYSSVTLNAPETSKFLRLLPLLPFVQLIPALTVAGPSARDVIGSVNKHPTLTEALVRRYPVLPPPPPPTTTAIRPVECNTKLFDKWCMTYIQLEDIFDTTDHTRLTQSPSFTDFAGSYVKQGLKYAGIGINAASALGISRLATAGLDLSATKLVKVSVPSADTFAEDACQEFLNSFQQSLIPSAQKLERIEFHTTSSSSILPPYLPLLPAVSDAPPYNGNTSVTAYTLTRTFDVADAYDWHSHWRLTSVTISITSSADTTSILHSLLLLAPSNSLLTQTEHLSLSFPSSPNSAFIADENVLGELAEAIHTLFPNITSLHTVFSPHAPVDGGADKECSSDQELSFKMSTRLLMEGGGVHVVRA